MSIKKKLGLGLASAALGVSLVGGGTFAYFSDEATIHNAFAAGTLDMDISSYATNWPVNFDLKDIRPGDTYERTWYLNNKGSLNIEDIYLQFGEVSVSDPLGAGGTRDAFLDSLVVNYFVDQTNGDYLLLNSKDITLKEAIAGQFADKIKPEYITTDGKLNLTPDGIDVGKNVRFRMMITFKETNTAQNEFQGMLAKVNFNFDARQEMGPTYQHPSGPNNANFVDPDVTDTGVND
jgi:spore coat-associated protein N